ncbi:MAG: protein kinase [Vicinamibacterales bacterium]
MPLQPGQRLGPYEIVAPIGAGGMGEVYRARDARLARDVAVKVLPEVFAQDAERRQRFEREGKAAATLNHPNVMAVFDVGVQDGVPYVVAELLEGRTLRERLSPGALSPRTATDLAIQIARGLSAAHARGIVHRDLKPANIFVTTDGRAKILDFGLARLVASDADASVTQLPAAEDTHSGRILGTAGYMAPEQVRGEPADARADIFAFGAVYYEMLTGQPAFSGDSSVERMSAILKLDPPPAPAATVPPSLDRLVRRCLEKVPAQRFQSASDVAFALEALDLTTSVVAPAVEAAPARRRGRGAAIAAAAAVAAVVVTIGAAAWLALRPAAAPLRFEALTFDRLPVTNARFMPDGRTIVYSASPHGYVPELFIIDPLAEAPRALGVPAAHLLAVSAKGELALIVGTRHLGQRQYAGTLARMTLGSSPRSVLENVREADWSPDGEALAIVHDLGNGRDRLEYPAGTALHEASGYLSDPRVSPDGSQVAFFEHQWRFDDRGWVKVVDRSGRVRTLGTEFFGLAGLAWTADGASLVFSAIVDGGQVMQPMTVEAKGGTPARPLFGVPGRFIVYDVGRDGRMLAVREDLSLGVRAKVPGEEGERDLSWLGSAGAMGLSRDGAWVLMVDVGVRGGRDYGVVLRRSDGSTTMRLGPGMAQKLSPDGKWAAALIAVPPQLLLYPTGPGEARRIDAPSIGRFVSAEWFADSRRLLVCGTTAPGGSRCYIQDLEGAAPTPVTPEGVTATVAPDGRTLLRSSEDGTFSLAAIDGGAETPVPALRPGDRPIAWSGDSQAIYVQYGLGVPATVERVDLRTGARSVVQRLSPEGAGAIAELSVTDWVDDGQWYVYNYTALPSTLFVVTGAID